MALLKNSAAPLSRRQTQPGHLTVSGFILSPCHTWVLLIQHRKLGLWLQPGGHLDALDKSLIGTAAREISEETGLGAEHIKRSFSPFIDLDIHEVPAYDTEPAHKHYDVRFVFTSTTTAVTPSSAVKAASWFPLGALPCDTDHSVRRVCEKIKLFSEQKTAAVATIPHQRRNQLSDQRQHEDRVDPNLFELES